MFLDSPKTCSLSEYSAHTRGDERISAVSYCGQKNEQGTQGKESEELMTHVQGPQTVGEKHRKTVQSSGSTIGPRIPS
jgi:hypothetical protein